MTNQFDYEHFSINRLKATSIVQSQFNEYIELSKKSKNPKEKEKIIKRAELQTDVLYSITQITECYVYEKDRADDLAHKELLLKKRVEYLVRENNNLKENITG